MSQSHEKFAVFIDTPDKAAAAAEAFVIAKNVAAKSISVEQDGERVILTLGYNLTDTVHPIKITTTTIGQFDRKVNGSFDPAEIEAALTKAAEGAENVICHDFYRDSTDSIHATFLLAR